MRLGCIVLVAVATLLVSCGVIEATSAKHDEATASLAQNEGNDNRFLKSHTRTDQDPGAVDEERGAINSFISRNDFKHKILSKMLDDDVVKQAMIKQWAKHGHSAGKVRKELNLWYNPRYTGLLVAYVNRATDV
ncbi:hypothetical protein PRNP1_009818 [Phytophthora ramorum]